MSFFSKVKELIRMVFGAKFTEKETRSHDRLCNKFISKVKLGVADLKEIKEDLVKISEKGAGKMVKNKMNRLIRKMKVKKSDAFKIQDEKDYKKFLNREIKRVYDLSSDKVKRVKNIIKGKKRFVPEIEEDVQFVVFPAWFDMDKEVYRELAKNLRLDEILDDLEGVEYGKVSVKDESKWFSAKNVERVNKYYDRHPRQASACNQPIKEFLTNKGITRDACDGCIEYRANIKYREMIEAEKKANYFNEPIVGTIDSEQSDKSVQTPRSQIVEKSSKSKDDLFEIKDKNKGKRPRLKKEGFEFPHIIYCSTPDGVYHPQIFHPLQLARLNFHKRHPRFRNNYETEVHISPNEIEAEKAYRKLLRRRYKLEVEMIDCFLKDEEYFRNEIPNETCTMVLNINCEDNRKLYSRCLNYLNKKSEILNKYNLTDDMTNIKLKKEIKLDGDLSAQRLDPNELYNELKILSEEEKYMDEEDFPDDWYTDERESDIEEGEGRIFSSKMEDRFSNPTYISDNRMSEVVDHGEERKFQLRQEALEKEKDNIVNSDVSLDEMSAIDEDKFTNKKVKKDDTIESSHIVTNDAFITVNKLKKTGGFKARRPAPKIDAYEQIIKRHDELIKKRADDDAEMERIGQKAREMVMEKLYGVKGSDSRPLSQGNDVGSDKQMSNGKAAFFEHIRQDKERKRLEDEKHANMGLFNVKDKNLENVTTENEVISTDQGIKNNGIFLSNPIINNTDDKEFSDTSPVDTSKKFIEEKSSSPSFPFMGQISDGEVNGSANFINKPVFNQSNNNPLINSGGPAFVQNFFKKDEDIVSSTRQNNSIENIRIPDTFINNQHVENSSPSQHVATSSFNMQSTNMANLSNTDPFAFESNTSDLVKQDQFNSSNFNSFQNITNKSTSENWSPTSQPADWRPSPRFGGAICSPLDLPQGPPINIDPTQHGPWGHIDMPDREPPKDEDWKCINRPLKRERTPTNAPKDSKSATGQINNPFSNEVTQSILSFKPPDGQTPSLSPSISSSANLNMNVQSNVFSAHNPKQVSSQDIFNTNRGGGMFDSIIESSNNQEEDDALPSIQYRNMNDEDNNGFNFFFK